MMRLERRLRSEFVPEWRVPGAASYRRVSKTRLPVNDFAPEWLAAIALALVDIVLSRHAGLHFTLDQGAYWLVAPLFVAALIVRRHSTNAALLLNYFALLIFSDTAVRVATYDAAALAGPLWDSRLIALDTALGFDWIGYFHFIVKHGELGAPLGFLYYRIGLFALFFMVVMSFKGDRARLREVWWLLFIASLLTALGAFLVPVLGPFHTYHLQECCGQFVTELEHIRSGHDLTFPLGALTGVVQCPSFHTTLALALPYAFRRTPLCATIAVFNAIILFAVPVFGGHYASDMIAGALTFALALATVKHFQKISAGYAWPEFFAASGGAYSAAAPSR